MVRFERYMYEERRGRKCEWVQSENAESMRPRTCAAALILDTDTKY